MTDLTGLGDSWEELVSTGIVLAEHMDTNRWALGDIGCKVETTYGENSMGRFSAEIGIANAQTFRDYTRVARRFEPAVRNAYQGSTITFTHFRAAIRTGEDAELWIARAADEGWSVRELGRQIAAAIGKPVPPKLVWQGRGRVEEHGTYIELALDGWPEELLPHNSGVVIVKVYEGGQE